MLLYRYERLGHLTESLRSNSIWIAHPSTWGDPYEHTFLTSGRVVVRNALVQGADGLFRSSNPLIPGAVSANMTVTNPFGRFIFVQCFTSVAETERLWLWAKSEGRVRVCIDSQEYLIAVQASAGENKATIAEVTYFPENRVDEVHREFVQRYGAGIATALFDKWSEDVTIPMTMKREEFSDEHEFRLIFIDTSLARFPRSPDVPPPLSMMAQRDKFVLNMSLQPLIRQITLPPSSTEADIAEVARLLESVGYRGTVEKSQLYKAPVFSRFVDRPFGA